MCLRPIALTCQVALILAFGMGVAGFVSAQEEPQGHWLTRWYTGSVARGKEPNPKKDVLPPAPTPSIGNRLLHAKADLLRRQEVCQALREFADEHDDEKLRREADRLDARSWAAYEAAVRALGLSDRSMPTATKKGDSSPTRPVKESR